MAVAIQARKLVRMAKKNNISISRRWSNRCGLAVTASMVGLPVNASSQNIAHATGRSIDDLEALEMGFEGWDRHTYQYTRSGRSIREVADKLMKNRYFKVGQRLAKLIDA